MLAAGLDSFGAFFTQITTPSTRLVAAHRLADGTVELSSYFLRDDRLLDALGTSERQTRFSAGKILAAPSTAGQQIDFDTDKFARFSHVISPLAEKGQNYITGFLFAVAKASQILYQTLLDPKTEEQRTVKDLITARGLSPVYTSLTFHMPNGIWNPKQGTLDYSVSTTLKGVKAEYALAMAQAGNTLYQASLSVRLSKPGVIAGMVEMAKG